MTTVNSKPKSPYDSVEEALDDLAYFCEIWKRSRELGIENSLLKNTILHTAKDLIITNDTISPY